MAALVVVLGAVGAARFASSTFTISRSVMVSPAPMSNDPTPAPERREMRIECSPNSSYYVSERGMVLIFNVATAAPEEDPRPYCDDARTEREVTAGAVMVVSLLGAGVLIVTGRVRHRRVAIPQDASADAVSPGGTAT